MSRSKINDDDRVIADMSSVDRPSLAGDWFGRAYFGKDSVFRNTKKAIIKDDGENIPDESTDANIVSEPSASERRAFMAGSLRAGLLIGGVYIIVFGIFIALLLLIWK
ncbi:MAG: hypothetical protein K6F00_05305 [Lachnospiraceae bacterium]|nr:hypothetical protein [Lachnospiraceae bacterium]